MFVRNLHPKICILRTPGFNFSVLHFGQKKNAKTSKASCAAGFALLTKSKPYCDSGVAVTVASQPAGVLFPAGRAHVTAASSAGVPLPRRPVNAYFGGPRQGGSHDPPTRPDIEGGVPPPVSDGGGVTGHTGLVRLAAAHRQMPDSQV